ncbi:MAG: sugar ABC transporter ATP-binding protein [Clostridia bacterium]|nr:sugar ABC transporter ATP-binding protein [Clostridia bacterium]
MIEPVLRLENINKKMSDFFAISNINLELLPGEVHAIVGENGSGKSTLMRIIAGTLPKDSGSIYLNGNPVDINSSNEAKKLGITMTHQEPSLFEHFSVAENVYFDNAPFSRHFLKTVNWSKMNADCRKLLSKLNIHLDSQKLVKDIGNAQRQLIEIAKAYVSNAKIILMDEPTSSFTESEFIILQDIIHELKKSGVSIFYISHRLDEIRQLCDRVTVMRDGEIIGTESICNMETSKLITMMTGLDIKNRYPKLSLKTGKEVLKVFNISAGNTLKDISFSLRRREIIGITGLAGSGKSKIAKVLFGVDRVDSGEIIVDNRLASLRSPLDAIKEGIGYVPEDRQIEGLFMYLKIFENISASSISQFSNKYVIDSHKEKDIATSFVDKLGIMIGTIYDKAENLSGGNQQKVILAKWMTSKSKIFILDEPTRGIDIAAKVDVYNMMNDLVRKGASIIMISSDIDELIGMCDRVMVLYGGKIVASIPQSEATQEKIMYYATSGKHADE